MRAVIRAEGLGKQYRIGTRERYGSLRDSIARVMTTPRTLFRRRPPSDTRRERETVWALRDASFEVRDGEILGIIGRNGSGKSTLLKILSRITEPSEGHVDITGRVGSLLEVGTGFHPELTGRENVFVNGAILGMRRREIAAKFDEIVAFSGVERFIDTPVKHYSSGMQMRLAFAVAAHLQPNILLVDEVLAVGDAEFQRRCLSKMQDVSHEGRTVILVSHQMNQIRRLCESAMWLDGGRIQYIGPVGDAIREYEHAVAASGEAPGASAHFRRWELADGGHTVKAVNRPVTIRAHLRLSELVAGGHYGVGLYNNRDAVVAGWAFEPISLEAGYHILEITIPQLPLQPGTYQVSFALFTGGNNLTGGHLVDKWIGVPPLTLDVPPLAHAQDEWAGVLNVPATFASRNQHAAPALALSTLHEQVEA
jgi:lipopolysaccharide transport system ATP-binding protein